MKTKILDRLFDKSGAQLVPTITDLAFTSFMRAREKNDEDGGPTDWFTDTMPSIDSYVAEMRTFVDETLTAQDKLIEDMAGALNFILAFYEPGQTYLDTNAWTEAEASGRRAFAAAKAAGYFGGP